MDERNRANRQKYRMVALDLDGTLLNSNHDISDATIEYLRRLHEKGFIVCIATGRSAACTAHIIHKLNLPPLLHALPNGENKSIGGFPLVCTNGARGLKILHKSYSEVGFSKTTENAARKGPRRSNTEPLASNINNEDASTNLFLNQTLIINEELFHTPLSPSLTLKTLALAHKLNCVTNYYHNHNIYAVVRNEKHLELTQRYGKLTGSTELYRYLNLEDGNGDVKNNNIDNSTVHTHENGYGYQKAIELGQPSKLLILCDTEDLDKITQHVRDELTPDAHVIRGAPPFFVEVLDPHVNKGHGLRRLCDSLSIPLEEVIAFGDGDNDVEFLQIAGWGVAMKNAREVLKSVANEVGEWSNNEDGVIKTLQLLESKGRLHFSSGSPLS